MRFFRVLLTLLVISVLPPFACADRGGFSPIGERVSESGQKAMIAWNGTHEILLLSTDVNSSSESEVVEIMPLPSNPVISKGEIQSFLKVEELVNTYLAVATSGRRYGPWTLGPGEEPAPQITITFQEMIGVHFLTVVRTEEAEGLILWLEDFLETEGYSKELPSDLEGLLSYYIQNEMSFFVIDMIKTNATVKTIDPLIYEFRTSELYYPLRISTLFSGNTDVSLFTITNNALNDVSIIKRGFVKKAQFRIKQETLAEISINITQLFSGDPYICYFGFSGSLKEFDGDISADFQSSPTISVTSLAILGSILGLTFLFLHFFANKIGLRFQNIRAPMTRRLEIALLFAGLVGMFLTWTGFFLPWGLVGYGKNGEVLIGLSGLYGGYEAVAGIVGMFTLLLLVLTPLYAYSLLTQGSSKEASYFLTVGGASIMLQVLISSAYYLYAVDIGVLAIIAGCSFTMLAGLLSFWRMKLIPLDIQLATKRITFRTYIVKRLLVSILTLVGISLFIFWLWYISPFGRYI